MTAGLLQAPIPQQVIKIYIFCFSKTSLYTQYHFFFYVVNSHLRLPRVEWQTV